MPLEMVQQVQETRRRRTRRTGVAGKPAIRTYMLSGALCASCGGRVTAQTKQRLRCRSAAQHAGCSEPSVVATALEDSFGEWIKAAMILRVEDRTKIATIIRAKIRRGFDSTKAARVRQAIVSVRARATTAPLLAVACSKMRSRPGSKPEYRTFGGIVIEGIEDLADIADGVA